MNSLEKTEKTLPLALAALSKYESQTLEELLNNLCFVGRPRISRMKDATWLCICEMHVSNAATTFEVRSDYNCTNLIGAVKQCAQRVIETLSLWS